MRAGKNLKPYQGLKQLFQYNQMYRGRAGKNLKPYQGLKPVSTAEVRKRSQPEKT